MNNDLDKLAEPNDNVALLIATMQTDIQNAYASAVKAFHHARRELELEHLHVSRERDFAELAYRRFRPWLWLKPLP